MRHLLLLRHAKSDWPSDGTPDEQRPLAPRGITAAKRMGRFLAAVRPPQRVVSSPAVRARRTAELARESGRWECELAVEERLYEGSVGDLLEVTRAQPDAAEVVCLVGHEPTWSAAVGALVGGGAFHVPTAAVADVALEIRAWSELRAGAGELRLLVTPKMLDRLLG